MQRSFLAAAAGPFSWSRCKERKRGGNGHFACPDGEKTTRTIILSLSTNLSGKARVRQDRKPNRIPPSPIHHLFSRCFRRRPLMMLRLGRTERKRWFSVGRHEKKQFALSLTDIFFSSYTYDAYLCATVRISPIASRFPFSRNVTILFSAALRTFYVRATAGQHAMQDISQGAKSIS